MITYLASSLPVLVLVTLTFAIAFGGIVVYALHIKGEVHAEFSHGKTVLRIDARDKRNTKRL